LIVCTGGLLRGWCVHYNTARRGAIDSATTFKALDPATLEPRHVWKVQGYAEWFVPLES
jgi:hypothetical protein